MTSDGCGAVLARHSQVITPYRNNRVKIANIALVAAAAAAAASTPAADFPNKPVRLVVGFAPGGGTDTTARALSNKLAVSFGQQVVDDNRPAHSGTLAAEIVAKSVPD